MKTIFVPVDFSTSSNNAAIYAANLADMFSAKLILFHAYAIPVTGAEMGYIPPLIDLQKETEDLIKKEIADIKKQFPTLLIDYSIKLGGASNLINETAVETGADIIIMGVVGHGGKIKEHLIGTTSYYLLKESAIPVLIIPADYKFKKIETIGFACDFEDDEFEKNTILDKVKKFCSLFGAKLEILNVAEPHADISSKKEYNMNFTEDKLQAIDHKTVIISEKNVAEGLLKLMKQFKMDIIIVRPKKHNVFRRIFIESDTKKMIFHSSIPVLGIKE